MTINDYLGIITAAGGADDNLKAEAIDENAAGDVDNDDDEEDDDDEDEEGEYKNDYNFDFHDGVDSVISSSSILFPHMLISNHALRYFWSIYFRNSFYVRWSVFELKLTDHLAAPRDDSDDHAMTMIDDENHEHSDKNHTSYPFPPSGYGLHRNELKLLFGNRRGGHHLIKALRYLLDLENTDVVSVYQLVLLTRHIQPATIPLCQLLYYLAHLGGKVLLPLHAYPQLHAKDMESKLHTAYQRSAMAEDSSNSIDVVLAAGMFSPYKLSSAKNGIDYLEYGGVLMRDRISSFVAGCRSRGGLSIIASPMGHDLSHIVVAEVRQQLHTGLQRWHSLLHSAESNGNVSVWDFSNADHLSASSLSSPMNDGSIRQQTNSSSGSSSSSNSIVNSLTLAQRMTHSDQPSFTFEEVADTSFSLTGLFDAFYVDLRGTITRADILSAFSTQLAIRGNDSSSDQLQMYTIKFLRSLRRGSVLILDNVHTACAATVRKFCTTLFTESNVSSLSVLVIAALQSASIIQLSFTSEATLSSSSSSSMSDMKVLPTCIKYNSSSVDAIDRNKLNRAQFRYYSSGNSGKASALEKEHEYEATVTFLHELSTCTEALGLSWSIAKIGTRGGSSSHDGGGGGDHPATIPSMHDLKLPSNVMVYSYGLSMEESKAVARTCWREMMQMGISIDDDGDDGDGAATTTDGDMIIGREGDSDTTKPTTSSFSSSSSSSSLEARIDLVVSLSAGIPCLLRLLMRQHMTTLRYLQSSYEDELSRQLLPSFMSPTSTGGKPAFLAATTRPPAVSSSSTTPSSSSSSSSISSSPSSIYTTYKEIFSIDCQALTTNDRRLWYALTPLRLSHVKIIGNQNNRSQSYQYFSNSTPIHHSNYAGGGGSSSGHHKSPATRPLPLLFDTDMAWFLSRSLFSSSSSSNHPIDNHRIDNDRPSREWWQSWRRLVRLGWLVPCQSVFPSSPYDYSNHHGVVDADNDRDDRGGDKDGIPFMTVHFSDISLNSNTNNTSVGRGMQFADEVSEEMLMNSYLQYVTFMYVAYDKELHALERYLLCPELAEMPLFSQHKQLWILQKIDPLMPHISMMTSFLVQRIKAKDQQRVKLLHRGVFSSSSSEVRYSYDEEELDIDSGSVDSVDVSGNAIGVGGSSVKGTMNSRQGNFKRQLLKSDRGLGDFKAASYDFVDGVVVVVGGVTGRDRLNSIELTTDSMEHSTSPARRKSSWRRMQSPQLMDDDDDVDGDGDDDALYTGITQAQAVEIVMQLKGHFTSVASLRLPSDICLTIAIQIKKVITIASNV
jgi:hypothetical protein